MRMSELEEQKRAYGWQLKGDIRLKQIIGFWQKICYRHNNMKLFFSEVESLLC